MRVDVFQYELPPELIAQRPSEDAERARLLRLRPTGELEQHHVSELSELLPSGALVIVNDTRVVPARLLGRKRDSGGRVEVLLVHRLDERELEPASGFRVTAQIWSALGKASKAFKFGSDVDVFARETREDGELASGRKGEPALHVRLLGRGEDGLLELALWTSSGESVTAAIGRCGHVPLPPYIKREDGPEDLARYQTVYARNDGAVAAPTAGLHLTNAGLGRLAVRGCEVASITLHVGLGTFQPVQVEDLDDHRMHAEEYAVTASAADAVARARARGAPVVAIGTTTARALESAADPHRPGQVRAGAAQTRLLIQPGYEWRVVDMLFTNFHLPRSTLLAMVCSFGGVDRVLAAYREAVRARFRFFSYGDAMLLSRNTP